MGIKKETAELIDKIHRMYQAEKLPNYIEYIRFPFYKNMQENVRIDFNFPLSVLTGPNGSGKSSVLHAVYGAPEGYSTGSFWFSTRTDPIFQKDRKRGEIPSFIYGYKSNGHLVEAIKRRTGSSKGLDYWEPSRPILMYGMQAVENDGRIPPIVKPVIYLDFRSELSAFDKYFHFGQLNRTITLNNKQDVLRKYSKYVRDSLDENRSTKVYNRKSEVPKDFDSRALHFLSKILGKSYSYCKIVFHNLYGSYGATVLFRSHHHRYTEAFAGRGEYAVAKLVYEIMRAEQGSLVVLDEPEVSLHPAAQEQLKLFLLKAIVVKKIQIVVSSHAPKIIEFLPDEAIKLFYEERDGKFSVLNNCSYYKAFHQIGERIDSQDKKIIVVEDSIAKHLIEMILDELGSDYPLLFQVVYYPGGAEDIYKASVSYSQENEANKFIILDGDKRKVQYDPQNFTIEQSQDIHFIGEKVKDATNCDIKKLGFRLDGNEKGANREQKIKVFTDYLYFNERHIAYFPLDTPEEIIWDEEYANNLLGADDLKMPSGITDYKQKFVDFSELFNGQSTGEAINTNQRKFIRNFIAHKNENYHKIVEIIHKFKNQTHADR